MLLWRLRYLMIAAASGSLVLMLSYIVFIRGDLPLPYYLSIPTTLTNTQHDSNGNYRRTSCTDIAELTGKVNNEGLGTDYLTEEELCDEQPLNDIQMTVSLTHSSVRLIERKGGFMVGENIMLFIILPDGNNKRREKGGDVLRVRNFSEDEQAYAAGRVTDHKNGTYTAMVHAYWPGRQVIEVMLAYKREAIRAMYHIRQKVNTTRTKRAMFRRDGKEDFGHCHSDLRWFKDMSMCDLTVNNSGMSWFCEKPLGFLCQDVVEMRREHGFLEKLPLTEAEERLFRIPWELFPVINVDVRKSKVIERRTLPDCISFPRELLWRRKEVTGYFYSNKWIKVHCKGPARNNYKKCMSGKHFILLGDSTTRQWFNFIMGNFTCNLITDKWTERKWYKRSFCESNTYQFKAEWTPHALPFFGHGPFSDIYSMSRILDGIDNRTEVVVLIHMFCHVLPYHHSVFKDRMKTVSESVARLLRRNKYAKILIKGPSTYKYSRHYGDYLGNVFEDILFDAFKEMHDKVVYLNVKDLTIAKAISDIHPVKGDVGELLYQMLDYVCE